MPFVLKESLGETGEKHYWTHNSWGEHAMKHMSDPDDVSAIREERRLHPYGHSDLYAIMERRGLRVVRQRLAHGEPGDVVGYGIVRRKPGADAIHTLEDLYVAEKHRNRGIGGYLLGDLLTNAPCMVRDSQLYTQTFGKFLVDAQTTKQYHLPGMRLVFNALSDDDENIAKLTAAVPPSWTGIRTIITDSQYDCQVFQDGDVAARILEKRRGYSIEGDTAKRVFESEVIAAMYALNDN